MRYYIRLTNTSNLHDINTKIHWIKSILRYFHWIIFRQMEIISKIQNIMLKTTTCSHKIFTWLPSTIKQLLEKFNFKLLQWSFQQTLNKWREARHISCQVKSSWVLAILEDSSDLAKCWLTYLTMIDLLLSTIYATQTGDREMLSEYVRDTAGNTFGYGNYNYARYTT